MRILFVSHYFYPEPNFFACLPFAKLLAGQGHDVEVLTGFPHYPGSKLYDGYRMKLLQREVIEGVPVCRVPLFMDHTKSTLRRSACYLTFALSASTIGNIAAKRADVVLIGEGPGTNGLVGCVRKLFRGTPFVVYVLDLWPETLAATGMLENKHAIRALGWTVNHIYRRSARVIASTPGYKKLIEKKGIPADKINLIYGWCNNDDFVTSERNEELENGLGMRGKFNVVFAGNMGKAQALEAVIDAADIVAKKCADVRFVFVGDGLDVEKLKRKVASLGLQTVRFIPRQPISEIGPVLKSADVLLIHLKNDFSYKITIPSKTVVSMLVGRPLLVAVGGDTDDLVKRAQAGISCEPENPESIAQAVIRLRNMPDTEREKMGHNGREFYLNELSGHIAVKKFESIFEEVIREAQS